LRYFRRVPLSAINNLGETRHFPLSMEIFLKRLIVVLVVVPMLLAGANAQTSIGDIWKKIEQARQGKNANALTDDKIVAGLKDALSVGTDRAVAETGKPDGFLKNAAIKILLPPKLQKAGKTLRMIGMGSQVDALETGMNRAAEQAAPQAKQIFLNAVMRMTFSDARHILTGGDTAATDYFKNQSSADLTKAFAPIVHQAMENVGVVRQYNKLMQNPLAAPLASDKSFNLDDYVMAKTVDGLFYMLGQEEKKIRTDPAAQTTAILKEVFGSIISNH
jgi:uncharacterized protein DUF4197